MCQSQQSTSSWACHCTTYRLILQAHRQCSFWQNQHSPDVFPLVAIYGGRTAKASPSAFWLLTKRLVVQAHPGTPQIHHTLHYEREWATKNSLIPLPLPSVDSDKGWQSLSPGTLVLLAGPIGLMVTQTTKVNENKDWIIGRCQSRVISKLNISLSLKGIKFFIDLM